MKFFTIIILIFFTVITLNHSKSQEKLKNEVLSISVNGLVCDFCARSIEKLFSKKESVKRVVKSLKDFDKSLEVRVLDSSARTATDAASSLNCEVGAIVKSLLLRTDDDFVLCLEMKNHSFEILPGTTVTRQNNWVRDV